MDVRTGREAQNDHSEIKQPRGNVKAPKPSFISRGLRRTSWLAAGPADWFGRKSVGSGGGLISKLWRQARTGQRRDSRFKLDGDGGFDLEATAFSYGVSVETLEQLLEQRRRMTFCVSYGASLIAFVSVIFWIHAMINVPYTLARVMMAYEFLPFFSLFVLVAVYQALLNFQIRMRRFATWREFLSTDEGFYPR